MKEPILCTPVSLYAVEVQEPIKGSSAGTVLVFQAGWFYSAWPVERGDPLLSPGETAVFVTIEQRDSGFYFLVEGHFGHLRIHSEAERANAVARFATLVRTPVATRQL